MHKVKVKYEVNDNKSTLGWDEDILKANTENQLKKELNQLEKAVRKGWDDVKHSGRIWITTTEPFKFNKKEYEYYDGTLDTV